MNVYMYVYTPQLRGQNVSDCTTDSFYLLCVSCELTLGPLQDQKVLLITESSFQPSKKEFPDQLHLEKKKSLVKQCTFFTNRFSDRVVLFKRI